MVAFMLSRIAHNTLHPWHERVEAALSEGEVIANVQDFLKSLAPSDIARLPEDSRPRSIHDTSDIDYWSLRLAQSVKALWGTQFDQEVLIEVERLFLRASHRLSCLADERAPRP
jgi:hypothetical protein